MDSMIDKPVKWEKPAISDKDSIIVSMDADLSVAIRKIILTKVGVICVDFSGGQKRVAGVITPASLRRAGGDSNVRVSDIMNRNFQYTTIEHLDRDVKELSVSFMPVVDDNMNLLFVVYRESCHLWNDAQVYELNWWRDHVFKKLKVEELKPYSFDLPEEYSSMIREKVADGHNTCIELGAGGLLGFMRDVPSTNKRIIIEPLCEHYAELRKQCGVTFRDEESIIYYPNGADTFICDLKESADVIFTRNAIDHTPEWPFILGNIAEYARKGCLLYIANYIDYHKEKKEGHFNITYNPEKYLRLIRQLGFEIIWHGYWADPGPRAETWVSCFARKI